MTKYALTGNWSSNTTWSTSSGGPNNTTAPNQADDVKLDANSGNVALTTTASCRSLDCTGYINSLSGIGQSILIGDAAAGLSNIAVKLSSTMTIASIVFFFESTSGATQTVDFAGKTISDIVFEQTGIWQFTGTMVSNARLTLTRGNIDINGQTLTMQYFRSTNSNLRTMTGSGTITLNGPGAFWECTTATNLGLTGFTANIIMSGGNAIFTGGVGQIYGGTLTFSGSGTAIYNNGSVVAMSRSGGNFTVNENCTLASFTYSGEAAARTFIIAAGKKIIFLTNPTIAGSSGKVLSIISSSAGSPATITVPTGNTFSSDYLSIQDITALGGATFNAGSHSTNVSGNSGWNFGNTILITDSGSSKVGRAKVTANGNVTSDGGNAISERGFVYATTVNPTTSNTKSIVAGTTGAYSVEITGLALGTNYYYRAYAINSDGTTYAGNQLFKVHISTLPFLGV